MTSTYRIEYLPADDRGTVGGAHVTLSTHWGVARGHVITRRHGGFEAWLGDGSIHAVVMSVEGDARRQLLSALDDAAQCGTRGESGIVTLRA